MKLTQCGQDSTYYGNDYRKQHGKAHCPPKDTPGKTYGRNYCLFGCVCHAPNLPHLRRAV